MMKQMIVFAFVATIGFYQAIAQTNLYVSPTGKDTNVGTLKKPFKTIERARQEVDKLNDAMQGDITVHLRGGNYFIDKTLAFTEKDGGIDDFKVIYKAYENEKPVITSGIQITDWTPHEKGIWKAPAKGMLFRQIYVDNKQGIRSRTPNKGDYYRIALWNVGEKEVYVDGGGIEKWNSTPDLIKDWNQFERVEMILQMSWTEQIMRLKSYEKTSTTAKGWTSIYSKVKFQDPEGSLLFQRDYPAKRADTPFHLENAYEFIDEPGEWYLDIEADELYYLPKKGENMQSAEVIVGSIETLLKVVGKPDHKVKNLSFEGLKFAYTNWTLPSKQGLSPSQASQYNIAPTNGNEQYIQRPSAAIYVENAENFIFHKNEVTRVSNSVAIDYHYGIYNSFIKGNVIHQISGAGIMAAKFSDPDDEIHKPWNPEDERELTDSLWISNNLITNIGINYPGCVAIGVGWGKNTIIEHNEISHTPYSGISVGWGWTNKPNVMEGNIIRYNNVHHISELLADAGGIYTLSYQPGTEIYRNYVHDSQKSKWGSLAPFTGIYLDQGSGGSEERPMIVKENLVTSGGHTKYFFHIIGKVNLVDNLMYSPSRSSEQYVIDLHDHIVENAGLQNEYSNIKNIVSNN